MSENLIEDHIVALTGLSDELAKILSAEKDALVSRDLDALAKLTETKQQLCSQIERQLQELGPEPLSKRIAALPDAQRRRLDPLHRTLVERASEIQNYNAVNGKIVRRSQQSVRELLNLMSGTDDGPLYGQQGQALGSAQGTAIARA
jgi:flagella synthesis protein FlgN